MKESALGALRKYGVGSCGPPGFYGTFGAFCCSSRRGRLLAPARHAGTRGRQISARVYFADSPLIDMPTDVHQQLERNLASFLGQPSAIIYAQSFSCISSVIPAFAKRSDVLVIDRGCNFAIMKGAEVSRSKIVYYEHGVRLECLVERCPCPLR